MFLGVAIKETECDQLNSQKQLDTAKLLPPTAWKQLKSQQQLWK